MLTLRPLSLRSCPTLNRLLMVEVFLVTLAIPPNRFVSDEPRFDPSEIGEEVFLRRKESRLLLSRMPDEAAIRDALGEVPDKCLGARVAAFIASSREPFTVCQQVHKQHAHLSFGQTIPRTAHLPPERCIDHGVRTTVYSSPAPSLGLAEIIGSRIFACGQQSSRYSCSLD